MKQDYMEKVKTFDINSLPDLDEIVLGALQYFNDIEIPKIDTETYSRPLVIGSVNAFRTGQIIFEDTNAIFADEGSYRKTIEKAENYLTSQNANRRDHEKELEQLEKDLASNKNKSESSLNSELKGIAKKKEMTVEDFSKKYDKDNKDK